MVSLSVLICLGSSSALAQTSEGAEEAESRLEEAEHHYQLGAQLFGQGRYREALEAFDRSLTAFDDPLVHCNRAAALLRIDEVRGARDALIICRDSYENGSEDFQFIDAQVHGLTIYVEYVRPRSIEVARDIAMGPPERREPLEEPFLAAELEPRLSGLGGSGIVLLSVAVAGGVGAFVFDLRSAALVEAYRRESLGGPGTSRERYQSLREELEERQAVFQVISLASIGFGVLGATMLGVDLVRVSRDRKVLSLDIERDFVGVSFSLSY